MSIYRFTLENDIIVKADFENEAIRIAESIINQHLICEKCDDEYDLNNVDYYDIYTNY
jgi:hypothetical protein